MSKRTVAVLVGGYLATILVASWLLLWGLETGFIKMQPHDRIIGPVVLVTAAAIGLLFLFFAIAVGVWVHGDARRRGMPPLLWALIATFGPNFMGLVVYLVVRKPLHNPCPSCGETVPEQASFCPHCRAGLQRVCTSCGAVPTADARFCPRCGASMTERV